MLWLRKIRRETYRVLEVLASDTSNNDENDHARDPRELFKDGKDAVSAEGDLELR